MNPLLTVEDRSRIPLALPRPQLLRVICGDANFDDPLELQPLLREKLRAINDVSERGDTPKEFPVMYLDAAKDLPGAFNPKLIYAVDGENVTVRIRLTSGKDTVAEQTVSASLTDKQALAAMLAQKVVAMAVQAAETRSPGTN
jgi:hypothetical protein